MLNVPRQRRENNSQQGQKDLQMRFLPANQNIESQYEGPSSSSRRRWTGDIFEQSAYSLHGDPVSATHTAPAETSAQCLNDRPPCRIHIRKNAASANPKKVRQTASPLKLWTAPVHPEMRPQIAHMTQMSEGMSAGILKCKQGRLTDTRVRDLRSQHV